MREIHSFIVHCSDSTFGDVETIRRWHLQRGWSDIGYHYVIRRDGTIEVGRPLVRIGAHVKGHNTGSVGVCLIGEKDFTAQQFKALQTLWEDFKSLFPGIQPYGHRDFTNAKTCPNFEVRDYIS